MKTFFNDWWKQALTLGLVLVGAVIVGMWLFSGEDETSTGTTPTVTAARGDLDATATAAGRLEAQRQASLAVQVGGVVESVFVRVGDGVQAGDLLLQLEQSELQRAVLDAEQALLIQEEQLSELLAPAGVEDLAAAEANVASAQARLDRQLAGPSAEEVAAAEADLRAAEADVAAAAARLENARGGAVEDELLAAENVLAAARIAYTEAEEAHRATYECHWNYHTDQYDCQPGTENEEAARVPAQQALADLRAAEERLADLQAGGDEAAIASAQAALTSTTARRDSARASLDLLVAGASEADVAAAEANLARVQSQLETLRDGPTAEEIARQESLVAQARITLDRARINLERASLVAPFDGIVTRIEVSPGETPSGTVFELMDNASLAVVLEMDEVDIGPVAVGQPAVITLESWPEVEIDGQVAAIATENTPTSAGTVVYDVLLRLEDTGLPVLAGMTADARLTTARRSDVLLLPNAAIKADRANGTFSVDVVTGRSADGALIVDNVPVTIGLRDGDFTQVTGGIEPGTEVAIGYNPPPRAEFGPGNPGPPEE